MLRNFEKLCDHEEQLAHRVIGAAIEVHKELGPGLLESAYEACLAREMELQGIPFERQVPLPVVYKDLKVDCGYRMDFVIDKAFVIETKSVEAINDVHEAQCLTYLRFSGKRLCLLLNFNVVKMKDGIKRYLMNNEKKPDSFPRLKSWIFFVSLCVSFVSLCVTLF